MSRRLRPGEHRTDKAPAKRRRSRKARLDAASDELTREEATAVNIADHELTIDVGVRGGTEVTRLGRRHKAEPVVRSVSPGCSRTACRCASTRSSP